MSLTLMTLASMRQNLLGNSAANITSHLKKSFQLAPGEILTPYLIPTRDIMMWDAVAYAIVNIAVSMGGKVYGGFVAAHFSGLPTTDIDISLCSDVRHEVFLDSLIPLLSMMLNYRPEKFDLISIRVDRDNTVYSDRYKLLLNGIGDKEKECVQVIIDISGSAITGRNLFVPASHGRNLSYSKDGFSFANLSTTFKIPLNLTVNETIDLLRNAKDKLILCPKLLKKSSSQKLYKKYMMLRTGVMEHQGYTFTTDLDLLFEHHMLIE